MKVLVTGATGFVGQAVVKRLAHDRRHTVVAAVRVSTPPFSGAETLAVGDLSQPVDWRQALKGVEVVVHMAGRAHIMNDTAKDPRAAFRRINAEVTLELAAQAAQAGVKRLIFLSSAKVNGEFTHPGFPFGPDLPDEVPTDPYALSKYEAETGLRELAEREGLEVTIIRPPLVYGPGVKANFLKMMQWLRRGMPLPLGAIHNQRSLVALDNLVDLIVTCLDHQAARNQTFMVSDGEDLSTTELLIRLGRSLQRPARLVPIPTVLIRLAAYCVGRPGIAQRLCDSLQVDISKTRRLLSWNPPVSVDVALKETAEHWLATMH